jgi:3-dehydroshikimate dehydratase
MIDSGLVSVSFRALSPREVVDLVCQAGLSGIEWGGDVHVPHGDIAQAGHVRKLTEDAGLQIPNYGSYYRVGHEESGPFESVLETAVALGADTIRVWAGKIGSDEADADYRRMVIEDTQRIVDLAAAANVTVAYEFHGNTLTDSYASTLQLLTTVDRPSLRTFWQPPKGSDSQKNLDGLETIAPWTQHVHLFSWELARTGETIRLPLADHSPQWQAYLDRIKALPDDRFALLEFVRNDDPQQFLADAATLTEWLVG